MRRLLFALLVLIGVPLTGCATMFNSGDELDVRSTPAGADVAIDELEPSCTTPCAMEIKPDRYMLHIRLKGYKPVDIQLVKRMSGWFWANFAVGPYAVIGMGVDWLTGSIMRLDPNEIDVKLVPMEADKPKVEEEEEEEEEEEQDEPEAPPPPPSGTPQVLKGDEPPPPKPADEPPPLPASPEVKALKAGTPEPYLDRQIDLYYGGTSAKKKAVLRNRLYRIMLEQQKSGGRADLEEAIRVERERFGP